MILIGQSNLTLSEFSEILFKDNELAIDGATEKKVNTNFEFLQKFSSNKLIYGINTGFGPMAQYKAVSYTHLNGFYRMRPGARRSLPARSAHRGVTR